MEGVVVSESAAVSSGAVSAAVPAWLLRQWTGDARFSFHFGSVSVIGVVSRAKFPSYHGSSRQWSIFDRAGSIVNPRFAQYFQAFPLLVIRDQIWRNFFTRLIKRFFAFMQ